MIKRGVHYTKILKENPEGLTKAALISANQHIVDY